ncbi:MAG: extracellular solute-binding protein [Ignavibacteriales bacterium]|nr:MAG: extracellular solute-binding protein [Ignavibacteriales bacterium]
MKFEKIFYVVISAILITAFIMVSYISPPFTSGSSSAPLLKKIYFADNISNAHLKVIESFNKKFAGKIEVVPINLSFDKFSTNERKELLARYLRSKSERVDIFAVDQIWVPRFAKWGVPLEKYLTPEQTGNILSYAMESCLYNDTLIAIPLYIDVALMFYRDDILKQLPDYNEVITKLKNSFTWEEFFNLHERLRNKDEKFFIFQADDYEGLICIFAEMMSQQGKPFIRDGYLNLETPEAEKALQLLVDMVYKYKLAPKQVTEFKEYPSYDYFMEQDAVFLRGWPGFYSDENRALNLNEKAVQHLRKAPTPHFKGSKPGSVYGGWNLMISQYSLNIPEVARFVNYLTSDEAQKIMYEEGGVLPTLNSIYSDSDYVQKHPDLRFYHSLLQKGMHRPFIEDYTNISDILSFYVNAAIKKEMTVKEALHSASQKIKSGSIFLK